MATLDPAREAFAAAEYRHALAEDAAVKTAHPMARSWETPTLLAAEANAQTLASADLALHGVARRTYRCRVAKRQSQIVPGATVTVRHPRLFPGGKALFVVSVTEVVGENGSYTEIRGWG